jgi:hypothetical protein
MDILRFSEAQKQLLSAITTHGAKLSFSQFGEDIVVYSLFGGRKGGYYVDIGAHDPFVLSNTALLATFCDWHGVNVDVDDRAIARFEQHRPNDTNVCAAIGGESSMREVTLFNVGAVNTFDPKLASNPRWAPHLREKRMVQISPLHEILDKYVPPGQKIDYLNIDIEGLDYEAVASNNWGIYRPEILTVEIHNLKLDRVQEDRTCQVMFANGYRLFSYLFVTAVFIRL